MPGMQSGKERVKGKRRKGERKKEKGEREKFKANGLPAFSIGQRPMARGKEKTILQAAHTAFRLKQKTSSITNKFPSNL